MLPFGEYRPDVSDYNAKFTAVAQNTLPRGDGYGPFPSFSVYSSALAAACRGYYYAKKSDGSVVIFAGTSTDLFRMDNTTFTWIPVSKVTALTSISNASPAVFTLTSHGLSIGDAIVLATSGALPTGLTVGTIYYVITAGFTANAFQVSTTAGGTAVDTSSAGSGTHSFTAHYTALSATHQWQFSQFGNFVFAYNANVAVQVYDISSSVQFADLGGSPPQAAYGAVVGRFSVLSGLNSNPYRIHWSGLNATTTWTSGTTQSDFQDLPDGGIVRGVAGGEVGVIFQDGAIRRMTYTPGSPTIFQITRITDDHGLFGPYSIIRSGDRIFYYSTSGFFQLLPTGSPEPIGRERVDRTFAADLDTGNMQLFIGVADPGSSRVIWVYKSISGQTGLFDKALCYDWAIQKWSPISLSGEYIATMSRPGVTLDALDSISGSIDALTFSLDDVSTAAVSKLSTINSANKLGFLTGTPLEATIETAEHGIEGKRVMVNGFRPVTDAASIYGQISYRENLQDDRAWTSEVLINGRGMIPARRSSRHSRGRIRIPAGTDWTFASGVEPVAKGLGLR